MKKFNEECKKILKESKEEIRFKYLGGGLKRPDALYDYINQYDMELNLFSSIPKFEFVTDGPVYDPEKDSNAQYEANIENSKNIEKMMKDFEKLFAKVDKEVVNIMAKYNWKPSKN